MKKIIRLNSDQEAITLYGYLDERLRFAEKEFHVKTSARNDELIIEGSQEAVRDAVRFFKDALDQMRRGDPDNKLKIKREERGTEHTVHATHFFHKGKVVKPKSKNQDDYLSAMANFDVVIAIGPAGTGKTYLAMAQAIDMLKKKRVERIVLTRPAVEAGENLGFLPGDLQAKINPYLRPLYDALYDMMDFDEALRHIQRGIIEVAPLAYMRGRTLNDSFVILDEAQNSTPQQLKMFLTRLGVSSKIVVTGDITQIDLPNGKRSGLVESHNILKSITGIKFVHLSEKDVVRHKLVQDIIRAYAEYEQAS